MQNLKYHIVTSISAILLSVLTASTVNQIAGLAIAPSFSVIEKKTKSKSLQLKQQKSFEQYTSIFESGFFKMPGIAPVNDEGNIASPPSSISDLTLIGTITGSYSIARAMITKKGTTAAGVFALKKISDEITNDVFGNRLVKIYDSYVKLESGGQEYKLEIFQKEPPQPNQMAQPAQAAGNGNLKQTISRSEIQNTVLNDLDNAMQGLRAGPHRENDQIVGYRLISVRPTNILYKIGARSGDIIKRINGHKLDSTEKLYSMWNNLKAESKISVVLDRNGQELTYDLDISN